MAAAEKIAAAITARVSAEERKAYREAEHYGWTKTELNKLKPVKRRRAATVPNAVQHDGEPQP